MAKIAFLFPGQGSQFEGMGLDFIESFPLAKERYEEARAILGWSVADISKPENKEKLAVTCYTQPALYTLSCVIDEILKEKGITPVLTAGHSAGEYAALTSAGAWDFATGLKVIAERARLMHESRIPGGMAAVLGMDVTTLEEACAQSEKGLVKIANYNSPKQIVITGEKEAVEAIAPVLKEKGAKRVLPLPVSGAFHSPLMQESQGQFEEFLQSVEIHDPSVQWVSNNTAEVVNDANTVKSHLVKQFCDPVQWIQSMRMIEQLCDKAIETGAGKVLQGLTRQNCDSLDCDETSTVDNTEKVIEKHG